MDYKSLTIDIDFIDGTDPVQSDMQALEQLSHLSVADAAEQDPVLQLSSMEDKRPLLETFTGGKVIEMGALASTDLTTTQLSAEVATSAPEAEPTLPYQETRDYLPKVMDALKNYQAAQVTATETI